MDFGKYKETRHLKHLQVPKKEKLLLDISNIEDSFTGRNTFIFEVSHMIAMKWSINTGHSFGGGSR